METLENATGSRIFTVKLLQHTDYIICCESIFRFAICMDQHSTWIYQFSTYCVLWGVFHRTVSKENNEMCMSRNDVKAKKIHLDLDLECVAESKIGVNAMHESSPEFQ